MVDSTDYHCVVLDQYLDEIILSKVLVNSRLLIHASFDLFSMLVVSATFIYQQSKWWVISKPLQSTMPYSHTSSLPHRTVCSNGDYIPSRLTAQKQYCWIIVCQPLAITNKLLLNYVKSRQYIHVQKRASRF